MQRDPKKLREAYYRRKQSGQISLRVKGRELVVNVDDHGTIYHTATGKLLGSLKCMDVDSDYRPSGLDQEAAVHRLLLKQIRAHGAHDFFSALRDDHQPSH